MKKYIGDLSKQDAQILERYSSNAQSVLEFGVGGSTQIIAQSLPPKASFFSLDTDPTWISATREKLHRLGVADRCEMRRYEEWPPSALRFDLVFDDGADNLRREFALRSFPLLETGGVMLFHDTRRLQDVHNVLSLLDAFFGEIADVHLNEPVDGVASNITVVRKKAKESYVNWNAVEKRPTWAQGYGAVPESFWSSLVLRASPKPARTSMLIPCSHKHVHLLPELLSHLDMQSRTPDEIVISISGGCAPDKLPSNARALYSPTPLTAGQNRNLASEVATGDVFIYQDADDLPHPQRVEIIAHLFETYEIDHLMHQYFYKEGKPCRFTNEEAVAQSAYCSEFSQHGVTNGNVAIAQRVFQAVKWPEYPHLGEDQAFNQEVYKTFKNRVVTRLPLLTYRQNFSTF